MPTVFRGSINIDFTNQQPNEYQKLVAGLIQAGWTYVETSAFVIEAANISDVWRGIELVAKQAAAAGSISALTYHIQGSDDFTTSKPYNAVNNHPNALTQIQAKPFP